MWVKGKGAKIFAEVLLKELEKWLILPINLINLPNQANNLNRISKRILIFFFLYQIIQLNKSGICFFVFPLGEIDSA